MVQHAKSAMNDVLLAMMLAYSTKLRIIQHSGLVLDAIEVSF